ncbi:MAG TPA: hypothetical protein VGM69_15040 [Chloroflexota bacterium]
MLDGRPVPVPHAEPRARTKPKDDDIRAAKALVEQRLAALRTRLKLVRPWLEDDAPDPTRRRGISARVRF